MGQLGGLFPQHLRRQTNVQVQPGTNIGSAISAAMPSWEKHSFCWNLPSFERPKLGRPWGPTPTFCIVFYAFEPISS